METSELPDAIDALLAVDVDTLTDTELHHAVLAIERRRHRLAALSARLLSAWDARKLWADDGSKSAAARLSRDAGTSPTTAAVEMRRCRKLRSMPDTADAHAAGDLSPDHVDLLGRANQPWRECRFADHEADLVEHCRSLRFHEARRVVDYWCHRADAEAAEAAGRELRESRSCSAARTFDGMVEGRFSLDPNGGSELLDELHRLEQQLYREDQRGGTTRTSGQRRADALVEMARRSRRAAEGGLRPRPLLTILAGEDTFARMCELADGTVIAPGQIVPYLSELDIETVVFDGPRRVISVSYRRGFTGALRRAIEVRDRHCQHPAGCDEPAAVCDVDHIVPRSRGGITSQDNGRLECTTHNRIPDRHNRQPPTTTGRLTDTGPRADGESGQSGGHERPPPPAA